MTTHGESGAAGRTEVEVWKTYPAWTQFMWLYGFSAIAALRACLYVRFGIEGWEGWALGALLLLVAAAALRRWAQNVVTSARVLLRSGYTGKDIQSLPVDQIQDLTVHQGPLARFFGIGTIVITSQDGEKTLSLRGVPDPDVVKSRINALRPPGDRGSSGS